DVVQLFDSWAGAVAASEFDHWVINPTAEIVKRVKAVHPKVPIIGFANKAGLMYDPYVQKTGIDGVSIDSSVPVSWAASTLQGQCAVQGNLDPQLLVAGGAGLMHEAETILETLGQGPFVFNLGHGIVPETPPEHVAQLADFIRGWSR
ncbi:MAG: uroporphyrinogen decarboxylase family protein, partial [Alphaproteobacteria bacterium]